MILRKFNTKIWLISVSKKVSAEPFVFLLVFFVVLTMAKEKPERCAYNSNGSSTVSAGAKVKKFER